jgi:hypothetical protein
MALTVITLGSAVADTALPCHAESDTDTDTDTDGMASVHHAPIVRLGVPELAGSLTGWLADRSTDPAQRTQSWQ